MGRQRDPKRDEAFSIYKASGGEINLNVIAAQLGVGDGTVRGWKAKDNWDSPETIAKPEGEVIKKPNGTERNGTLHKKKKNAPKNTERNDKKKNVPKEDKSITLDDIENDELTDKQRLFCIYYVKYWNAGKAAKKAEYDCSYSNGFFEVGCQLLKKTQVKNEVDRLKKIIVEGISFEVMSIFQKYIDIAFADINDYLTFGRKDVMIDIDEEGKPIMQERNYVDFHNSNEVDGTLISEVKQGKDGVSIKLIDKVKALEFLTKYYDLLPDKHKRRVDDEKLKMDRERLELDKAKAAGEGDLDEELIDDWVGAVMDDGADEQEGEN